MEFKEFYQIHHRNPCKALNRKTKEQEQNITDEKKQEYKLALWLSNMKKSKKKKGKDDSVVYPSVEKILIELLGETWYTRNSKI